VFMDALVKSAPFIDTFMTAFGKFIEILLDNAAPLLPIITKAFTDLMISLQSGESISKISDIFAWIGEAFQEMAPLLPVIVQGFLDFVQAIVPYLPGIIRDFQTLLPIIISVFNFITEFSTVMIAAITRVTAGLAQAGASIAEFFQSIPDYLTEVISSMAEWVGRFLEHGLSMGKNLVQGIIQGIKESITDAVASVGELGGAVIAKFKNMLGIKSPSKVFEQFGVFTMQGLAQGITKGAPQAYGALSTATGGLTDTGSKGIEQFVKDMTELTGFGSSLVDFFRGITDIGVKIAKFATTDWNPNSPNFGKSTLQKQWVRTVTDSELARKKADEDYKKGLQNTGDVAPGTYGPSADVKNMLGDAGLSQFVPGQDPAGDRRKKVGVGGGQLAADASKQQIADYIITSAMAQGLSRADAEKFVVQAFGESRLDPKAYGASTGDGTGGASGIFQFTPGTWAEFGNGGDPLNPKDNIDAYMRLFAARGGNSGDIRSRLAKTSGGGPAHPANVGHWDQALQGAAPFIKGFEGSSAVDNLMATQSGAKVTNGTPSGFKPVPYGLPHGTNTGGYGTGSDKYFPQWLLDLGAAYGVKPSTYGGHQEADRGGEKGYAPNPQGLNRGVDWVGTPAAMEAFAKALLQYGTGEGANGGLEQVIFRAPNGNRYGLGGAGNDVSQGSYYDYKGGYDGHGDHVHTRFSQSIPIPGGAMPVSYGIGPTKQSPGGTGDITVDPKNITINAQQGANVVWGDVAGAQNQATQDQLPKTLDQIAQNTDPNNPANNIITDQQMIDFLGQNPDLKNAIEAAQAPNASDSVVGASLNSLETAKQNQLALDTPQSRYIASQIGGQQDKIAGDRGFTQSQDPIDQFGQLASGGFQIANDVIGAINEGIKSIGAAKTISGTLERGIENSEDIMKIIDQVQTFISFAGKIADTVSSVASFVGGIASAAAGADPSGGASGAATAAQGVAAIAGIVSGVLTSVNAAIDIGQEAYKLVSKYVARWATDVLGAGQGALRGNIKMLLDKNDWTLKSWSEDNPQDKRSLSVPGWMRNDTPALGSKMRDLNLYVGPGTDPNEAMNTGMWMIQTNQNGVFANEY